MRNDARKNLKKVATELIKDPLATHRELSARAGVGLATVNRATQELESNGTIDRSSTIIAIEDTDLRLVSLAQSKALEWMEMLQEPKREDVAVANQVARESQKRYSFLSGENANDKGGEKSIQFEIVRGES